MKHLILILFMGFSGIGYAQVSDHVLGTKNGCLDAGNVAGKDQILSNPSISQEYKDAYELAWYKCTYDGCWYSYTYRQVVCPHDQSTPTQPTNPRPDPFPCNLPWGCE